MRARLRGWLRWWPVAYGLLFAVVIADIWLTPPNVGLRVLATTAVICAVVWFAESRGTHRALRAAAERHGDDTKRRDFGRMRCGACFHYACTGERCSTCDGACQQTRQVAAQHRGAYASAPLHGPDGAADVRVSLN